MNDRAAKEALDRALDDTDRLLLLYQPIHEARSGAVYAAEALLRQRRSSGEIREAGAITEAAEASSGPELFRLDSVVVRRAYTDAAQWQNGGFPDVRLNVNLSPREFQEGNVLGRLESLVTACGIDTTRVNLEITETTYIEKPEETMEVLRTLERLGLGLWLDDFGTGHSSLAHLQHFPLHGLKIPGSFVGPLPEDRRCRAIVRSLLGLADELKLTVVAEGVENEQQLAFLLDHGCRYVQGFLYSKPVQVDELQALLQATLAAGAAGQ